MDRFGALEDECLETKSFGELEKRMEKVESGVYEDSQSTGDELIAVNNIKINLMWMEV